MYTLTTSLINKENSVTSLKSGAEPKRDHSLSEFAGPVRAAAKS